MLRHPCFFLASPVFPLFSLWTFPPNTALDLPVSGSNLSCSYCCHDRQRTVQTSAKEVPDIPASACLSLNLSHQYFFALTYVLHRHKESSCFLISSLIRSFVYSFPNDFAEPRIMYSMGMNKFQTLAKAAGAILKIDRMVLADLDLLDQYLESFRVR